MIRLTGNYSKTEGVISNYRKGGVGIITIITYVSVT